MSNINFLIYCFLITTACYKRNVLLMIEQLGLYFLYSEMILQGSFGPENPNFGLWLLNKLGPLVAKSQNEPQGTSSYGQGPILPSFIPKFQNQRQVFPQKPDACVSHICRQVSTEAQTVVDEWTPFGGSFLLLIHFALTYTFVYKYSAHRSEKVTRKAPNLYLQVCGVL